MHVGLQYVVQLLLFTHPKGASGTISEDLFSLGDQFFGFTRQYANKQCTVGLLLNTSDSDCFKCTIIISTWQFSPSSY